MAKPKSRYVCQACGSVSSRWQGQCPDCAEWNTLVQESGRGVEHLRGQAQSAGRRTGDPAGRAGDAGGAARAAAERARRVRPRDRRRDRRGLGDAGRRRSGHRQVDPCSCRSQRGWRARGTVIYVSGEESAEQVRLRAVRLGLGAAPVQLAAATSVRDILTTMGEGDARAAGHRLHPDDAFRPDRRRARHGQPGPRLGAGAGPLRQGTWHRGGARRPCHQGRLDRRPARARAYGRHRAELRRRAQPPCRISAR